MEKYLFVLSAFLNASAKLRLSKMEAKHLRR